MRAAIVFGDDLDVVVPVAFMEFVLDAKVRKMHSVIEVRQVVVVCPLFDAQGNSFRRPSLVMWTCCLVHTPAQQRGASNDRVAEEIIALERSALDRYMTADPQGYVDLYDQEVTYFDPTTETRVDGLTAMKERMAPMKNLKLPFKDPRYQMGNPKVQQNGDVALLTFNLVNYGKPLDRSAETVLARWNSTEIYSRVAGKWRIIHSHWSYTKPDIKQPSS